MKRNRLFLLAALLPALSVMQAQTSYEAVELLGSDLNGTARYVGMGGAMSALGADISTMATNPAGTALYRSWDMSMSASANSVTNNTLPGGNRSFTSYGSFDNLGIVMANKMSNEDIVRFVNFGVNYRNVKRFGNKMGMSSYLNGLSQTHQMAWQAWENYDYINYTYFDPNSSNNLYDKNYFRNERYGWLTLLGGYADLMGLYACEDDNGNIMHDENGNVIEDYWYRASDTNSNSYTEYVTGGINAYDFNLSVNLIDMVYFGVTFTTYSIDRNMTSSYAEYFSDGEYTLDNYYTTKGTGYDFKFGAIIRPIEGSSFRVGVSATTPTVYRLRDYNSAVISSNFYNGGNFTLDTQSEDAFGGDCYTDYTMIAPARINASLGGTVGTSLALGAEYEYANYGAAKLYYENGDVNQTMNDHTAANFTGQHTLRLGAEKMFAGSFYARAGYNFQTGGYKHDAWKMIPINSVQTNTAYRNISTTNTGTLGLGFRGNVFYADASLLYSLQSSNFYPFDDPELPATLVSRNLWKGTVTVGLRF